MLVAPRLVIRQPSALKGSKSIESLDNASRLLRKTLKSATSNPAIRLCGVEHKAGGLDLVVGSARLTLDVSDVLHALSNSLARCDAFNGLNVK